MVSKTFGIVGDPVSHSLSPRIHLAAYKELGLEWFYDSHVVQSLQLADFLAENRLFDGFSVTMPLKGEAFDLSEVQGEAAMVTGAVNTLLRKDQKWLGWNTDVFGIRKTIENVNFKSVAILGAGATSKSAIAAVINNGVPVRVYARNQASLDLLRKHFDGIEIQPLTDFTGEEELTVSTIPNFDVQSTGWVLNVDYRTSKVGAKVLSGKEMLIWQALAQIRIFLNGDPDQPLPNEGNVFSKMRGSIA